MSVNLLSSLSDCRVQPSQFPAFLERSSVNSAGYQADSESLLQKGLGHV